MKNEYMQYRIICNVYTQYQLILLQYVSYLHLICPNDTIYKPNILISSEHVKYNDNDTTGNILIMLTTIMLIT